MRIRDVGKVAGVIDTLVGAGANDIGNVFFEVSQASKLLDEAREKAVADARRKAEIYAKAAGVTLGVPLSISEEGAPQPVYRAKMMQGAPMAAAPTPIAQGEETLSVSVSVTWGIKGTAVAASRHCEERARQRRSNARRCSRDDQISNTCPGFSTANFSRGTFASSSASASAITGASIASSVNWNVPW